MKCRFPGLPELISRTNRLTGLISSFVVIFANSTRWPVTISALMSFGFNMF